MCRVRHGVILIAGAAMLALPAMQAQVKGPLSAGPPAGPRPISRPVQTEGASGTLERIEGDLLILRTPQGRKFEVMLASTTKYFLGDRVVVAESLKPGDFLKVVLKPGERGVFFAETVTVETVQAEEPVLLKRPSRSASTRRSAETPDDSGRPILRRNPPPRNEDPEQRTTEEATTSEPASEDAPVEEEPGAEAEKPATPPDTPANESSTESEPGSNTAARDEQSSVISVDAVSPAPSLIERAREQAFSYSSQLPNFICREVMTRTVRESHGGGWHTLDVVEADLVYEDGKEDYRNIRVGGKPQTAGMAELDGSSSTGEFASTLLSLFAPKTDADFTFVRTSNVNGDETTVYDFRVAKANSSWDVSADGKSTKPAYKGSVWIDNESARVRRLEMQAVDLTADISLDTIEMYVDYDKVRIGGLEYLLPSASENLACWRGTNNCARNRIEFRNYRKFGAESTIVTTDSDIKFEGDEKSQP